MHCSEFQQEWVTIGRHFGLGIHVSQPIDLANGRITAPVLLERFGGTNGMVLVTDYDVIANQTDELTDAGYGYSCLSDPSGLPASDDADIIELLRDWGWTGPGQPPSWYCDEAT